MDSIHELQKSILTTIWICSSILFKIYKLLNNLHGTKSTEIIDGLPEVAGHGVATASLPRPSTNQRELNDSTLRLLSVACKKRIVWIMCSPEATVIDNNKTLKIFNVN